MNLSDIKSAALTNVKLYGNAVIEATVENIYAVDTLQAEYRAEVFLARRAEEQGQVVSTDRWEIVKAGDGMAETWTIKFTCS